jgi:secondary thiamine-phosphate synthase enzyme
MTWTVKTETLTLKTRGRDHVLDITAQVHALVDASGVREGTTTVFLPGATASVTTLEFEPGLAQDVKTLLAEMVPARDWAHHRTWGDDNGGAHLRAALIGPSLSIPVADGKLTLGTWQQVVVIDHDTRPRTRRVVLQVMGQ